MNQNEIFYSLLRLSLGIAHDFPTDVSADAWQHLYEMSVKQCLVGVCYQGVSQLPPTQQPPIQLAMQWACEAEAIRGMNIQQNEEAARLTQLFAAEGRKTAILKGQANARLYPDKLSRTPGDIDIWVEGGRDNVIDLIKKMGMMNENDTDSPDYKPEIQFHHVHLPPNSNGIMVEVHFLPSTRIYNPLTNRRLQRWLEQEILSVTMADEGFWIPSIRFALVMQLAHIQKHFFFGGIGLRQLTDYYWLLRKASENDIETVKSVLKRCGLRHTAQALMWVLQEVFYLQDQQMLLAPDAFRGKWLLNDILYGGNFGRYHDFNQLRGYKRVLFNRKYQMKLMYFDFWENFWIEVRSWIAIFKVIVARIKKRLCL